MRIAQVAPLYESVPPKLYGGTERVVSYLTDELVKQGHDVTLYASGDSETTARLRAMCNEALRLQGDKITDPMAHHFAMIEQVSRDASEFDLIHFHIDYLHFPVTRRERLRAVTTLHGRLDISDLVPLYREFREMNLVSISNDQRKPLPWANWIATVYHGLPEGLLKPVFASGKYLAFIGRISPEKRVDRAIEIARRTDLPLKIAAKIDPKDQEYFDCEIRKLLDHPLIEFIGEIDEHQKSEFLGQAIALLFPIDWPEPFGLVMIEALACGTPVVAFPRGSVPEILEDGKTGFLVEDVDQAVEAVRKIQSIDRRVCRNVFEERFSAKGMCSNYLDVFNRLCERTPTKPSSRTREVSLAR